jgi:hypothetical protein
MFNTPRKHPFLVTMGIAAILAISIIAWVSIGEESGTVLYSPVTKTGFSAIKRVEMRIENGMVVLDIALVSPIPCNELYEQLGIESIDVGNKIYFPVCSMINPSLTQIRFKESISI